MTRRFRKILCAVTLLLILMAAMVGQKVHIFTEDPLHFVTFCSQLVPDNGARSGIAEKCVVDDYYFFPCLYAETTHFETYFTLVGTGADTPVCEKQAAGPRLRSLRAPPAGA